MSSRIGKILLIVGILFLIDALSQALGIYEWSGPLPTLVIGWYLTVLGASSVSLRAAAWTFLLLGVYLYFIAGALMDIFPSSAVPSPGVIISLSMSPFHILLGLILGVISFQKSKKIRSAIHNKK